MISFPFAKVEKITKFGVRKGVKKGFFCQKVSNMARKFLKTFITNYHPNR